MCIKIGRNTSLLTTIDGEELVTFITGGKTNIEVLVNVDTWNNYLHKFHWTAIKKGNYFVVKTSINKHSVRIHRMIVEKEYSELDYWGNTIDHINNNPLDNRKNNLRIYNTKLNTTNIKSKYLGEGMNLIYPQMSIRKGKKHIHGYKVHTNIFDETIYRNFTTIDEAKEYRDTFVIPFIEQRVEELKKKVRDIEFERGLRDKLQNKEQEEIILILKKYGIL